MKDYSAMTDFEINVAVFESIHNGSPDFKEGENGAMVTLSTEGDVINGDAFEVEVERGIFNPCNNPAVAWPIIAGNKISLDFDGDGYVPQQNAWCKASTQCGHVYYGSEKEPLRNAMIAFLMMKDAEKGHG